MNTEMLEFIKSRRSTRAFLPTAVSENLLNTVLEAGRYAPSGGNSQTTRFIVITNPDILNRLAVLAQEAFSKMEVTENTYRSLAGAINAAKKGNYVFHYGCPALIVTANKKAYGNNIADCACALENMMLMANALELGSVWINQLRWLNEDPVLLALMQQLGMAEDERVYGGLAVGYAATADGLPNRNPLPRTGNPVTWVR